jgi:hypothetical protein
MVADDFNGRNNGSMYSPSQMDYYLHQPAVASVVLKANNPQTMRRNHEKNDR